MLLLARAILFVMTVAIAVPAHAQPGVTMATKRELAEGREVPVALRLVTPSEERTIFGFLKTVELIPGYPIGVLQDADGSRLHFIDYALLERECAGCRFVRMDTRHFPNETESQKTFMLLDLSRLNSIQDQPVEKIREKIYATLGAASIGGFLFGSIPLRAYSVSLRHQGVGDWFTLHHTNFTEGIPLLWFFEYAVSMSPSFRRYASLISATACALGNVYCELIESHDPADLISGLAAIPVYLVLSKMTQHVVEKRMRSRICNWIWNRLTPGDDGTVPAPSS